jgi:hypothetical protein
LAVSPEATAYEIRLKQWYFSNGDMKLLERRELLHQQLEVACYFTLCLVAIMMAAI